MTQINFVEYILKVGLIFFIFFGLIIIFGYFFLYIFEKLRKDKHTYQISLLTKLLLSFGLGLSIYTSLSYFLNHFKLFVYETGYLSLIIFDMIFLCYLLIINRSKLPYLLTKRCLINFLYNKRLIISIFVIFFSYLLAFSLYWQVITISRGLIRKDPYSWLEEIYILLDNGFVQNKNIDFTYSSGFLFSISGFLLIIEDKILIYFFMKLMPLYILLIYLLAAFSIFKQLFNRLYLIIISMIFLLISDYFISRNLLNISSSLASIMVIISYLVIVNKLPDYLFSFFLAFFYLIHLLTFFIYVFVLGPYLFIKLLKTIKHKKEFFHQFIQISAIIFFFILLLIPFFVSYFNSLETILKWYRGILFNPDNLKSFNFEMLSIKYFLIYIFPLDFFAFFVESGILIRLHNIAKFSINSYFFLSIIGLFLRFKPKKKGGNKKNGMVLSAKFSLVLLLLFNLIPFFVPALVFVEVFKFRTLETFVIPIIILATLAIETILSSSKKLSDYIINKLKKIKYNMIKKPKISKYSKYCSIQTFLLLFMVVNSLSIYYSSKLPYHYYLYDDGYVEIVLYLRENANNGSIIYHPHFNDSIIDGILYDMENYHYNLTEVFKFVYYGTILDMYKEYDYLIADKARFPDDWHYQVNPLFKLNVLINTTNYILFKTETLR